MLRRITLCLGAILLWISPLCCQVALDRQHYELQYNSGYTLVSILGYHIKIIAEQRLSDTLAQVVVVPQEEGIRFQIQNLDYVLLPPSNDLGGPVAQVEGCFVVQVNQENPISIIKTVPVMVVSVEDFSISADLATIQGNAMFQKQLSHLLSDEY